MPVHPLHPVASGPRLQAGDILVTGGRECRVKALLKAKAVAYELHRFAPREFQVTVEYALAHRRRPPRKLPQTVALLELLRRGIMPPPALLRAATAEGHLDAVDRHGQNALHLAAQHGLDETVQVLCQGGATLDFSDVDGETGLMRAARAGHAHTVSRLLAASADVNATSLGGYSALMLASAAGRRESASLLLRAGACVSRCEHTTSDRSDAMRLACIAGHLSLARLLAGYGAKTTSVAASTNTMGSAGHAKGGGRACSEEITFWLRRCRAWPTPLHHVDGMAAERARELLRSGADVHARYDDDAPSPHDLACALLQCDGDGVAGGSSGEAAARGILLPPCIPLPPPAGELHTGAAKLVIQAARPWSAHTATLFPEAARRRAGELVRIGYALAAQYGGHEAHALCEIWVAAVMPLAIWR